MISLENGRLIEFHLLQSYRNGFKESTPAIRYLLIAKYLNGILFHNIKVQTGEEL